MSRPGSSIAGFSVLTVAFLPAIGLTAPAPAFAQGGGSAHLKFNPKSLNFGNVTTITTSQPQTVLATNSSTQNTIEFASIAASPPFLKVGDTCDSSLGGGQACQIDVECQPTVPRNVTGTLTFIFSIGSRKRKDPERPSNLHGRGCDANADRNYDSNANLERNCCHDINADHHRDGDDRRVRWISE
jgi:hypothetical protein